MAMMLLFGYGGGSLGVGDRLGGLGIRRTGGFPGGWSRTTDEAAKARAKRDLQDIAGVEISKVLGVWGKVVAGFYTAVIFERGTDGLPWLGIYFTSLDGDLRLTKLSSLLM